MEIVRIFWSGPYSVNSAIEKFGNYDDYGVYMITRLWGEESENILYIGKVYWRSFAERLAEHRRNWLNDLRGEVQIRIGKIRLRGNRKISKERVNDVETLLINRHETIYNTQSTLYYYGREIKIRNLGRKGLLKSEIYSEDY
jgi:hypothetical protein